MSEKAQISHEGGALYYTVCYFPMDTGSLTCESWLFLLQRVVLCVVVFSCVGYVHPGSKRPGATLIEVSSRPNCGLKHACHIIA